ncbi:UNVERIFIED_ORG: hypothetical protein GGD48_003913 [Rhizobium etli]
MQNIALRSVLHFCAAAALAGTAISPAAADSVGGRQSTRQQASENTMQQHPYVGMWVTDDGRVRHQLLPNGRTTRPEESGRAPIGAVTKSPEPTSNTGTIPASRPMVISLTTIPSITAAWCFAANDKLAQ